MIEFIDSHIHMEMIEQRGIDITGMMEDLQSMGFAGGLDIGVDIDDVERRKQIIAPYPSIRWAAGLYPGHAGEDIDFLLSDLEKIIQDKHPDALGEMGLDYHWDYGDRKSQRYLFIGQIELANRYGLPIVIHNRNADEDVLEILQSHRPLHGHILHCYSAAEQFLDRFIATEGFISIAGNLTFKNNSDAVKKAAANVPSDQLLVETDSPYLAPVPRRGKTNTPKLILHTYDAVAQLRNIDREEVTSMVMKNFLRLFPSADK
jgi:TatD DNase family protein